MSQRLVIGIGNVDRGDDGVGLAVAARIGAVETSTVSDCSELVDIWRDREDVVVVDAMVSGANPGTIHVFNAGEAPLPVKSFASSHAFGLPTAVELSRALGCLPESLIVYAIEAQSFDHGGEMSQPVKAAVDAVVAQIESESN